MATFNDFINNDADMLQYIQGDENNNNKQTSLSQRYNFILPIEGLTKEPQKRTKH